ncbi:GIY-YIG nuclease family protein [Chelatococcus sambhunathii]|uniref:GIY-YIG nuclease family protein n=1 Tax=Chelatococcus sambhunathii TaxID=363953 RepID=A0ABU1DF14_9HYPH|nr:GIY-YIG nuclease family protein [Chelatococcus sambhunathii]
MGGWVYILASGPGGTLYVGVTSDLIRRVFEHRTGGLPGFTKRYRIKALVYFERHETIAAAIQREKNIKHWPREWKIDLIVSVNPEWRDLFDEIAQSPPPSSPGLTRQSIAPAASAADGCPGQARA